MNALFILGGVGALILFAAFIVDVRVLAEIDRLNRRIDGVERELEVHLNSISSLSANAARVNGLKNRADVLEERVDSLEDKLSESVNNIESRVAEKMEKRWDTGLEKMMAWNPYLTMESDGEGN
jgi:predicted Holliday junction resolvase-like endonuclease